MTIGSKLNQQDCKPTHLRRREPPGVFWDILETLVNCFRQQVTAAQCHKVIHSKFELFKHVYSYIPVLFTFHFHSDPLKVHRIPNSHSLPYLNVLLFNLSYLQHKALHIHETRHVWPSEPAASFSSRFFYCTVTEAYFLVCFLLPAL